MSVYLLTLFLALLFSQGTKVVIALIAGEKGEWREALVRSGGMPSAHSSLMVSTTVAIGVTEGVDSPVFALAIVMTVIVMYDALNVRRSVGEQGTVIKQLITELKLVADGYVYKHADGHLPVEVIGGTMVGVLAASIALSVY